ncbi:hypothetical protein BJV74DRAFT_40801 [Russula compacta]|nr:hypothetical protein BJV74DRAFT_40801 [Russula compacta]
MPVGSRESVIGTDEDEVFTGTMQYAIHVGPTVLPSERPTMRIFLGYISEFTTVICNLASAEYFYRRVNSRMANQSSLSRSPVVAATALEVCSHLPLPPIYYQYDAPERSRAESRQMLLGDCNLKHEIYDDGVSVTGRPTAPGTRWSRCGQTHSRILCDSLLVCAYRV